MTATNVKQKLAGEIDELQLFTFGGTSKSFCADRVVNNKELTKEIDTGATVSLIYRADIMKAYLELSLQLSRAILKTYTGEHIPVLNEAKVSVQYEVLQKLLNLVVITGNGPYLLRRNRMVQFHQD